MRFESRTFWIPKDAEYPEQYQDAFGLDARRGVAAIADGVTSAIFSGPWARLVTEATVAKPPNLHDAGEFQAWLSQLQDEWLAGIDISRLTWSQRPKMADGGMTTLMWIELTPFSDISADCALNDGPPESAEHVTDGSMMLAENTNNRPIDTDDSRATESPTNDNHTSYLLRCYSRGDCELFHIRDDKLLTMFPLDNAGGFGLNPAVIGSMDRPADGVPEFQMIKSQCQSGDLLVLCTDALALWAINRWEAGEPVNWRRFWNMPDDVWREEMFALRREGLMRFDDTTLILLQVVEGRSESESNHLEDLGIDSTSRIPAADTGKSEY